ncbi:MULTISPECIES: glycosyltransferase family 61 protein [unclassified Paracoccus (in: a-proteobacteria)]|uniref:glycosyltransferase family 61 protein n=1 Tax=unclassified Paracoccus (in: a-proteobacteria) TaxID=2688777 RepID=UPI0021E13811|nr:MULTISPECIES: glycosyltransferase family 61 protein [unclassified Paracoccus (in: a-proteobacteria)]UXU75044.1 glycosyltransferase family 61 protein [Paracoccus sp. SMMA_5]UXU80947.1 glycosyltransferase family 61 protein [Paracoccus sp. SMMA_5_TC]
MFLNLDDPEGDLVELTQALVVPPLSEERLREQPSGVVDSEGRFVANSISWTDSRRPVNSQPLVPWDLPVDELDGHYLFGGIFYGHFGHFIVESLARLWALDRVQGPLDGIIFTPKIQRVNARTVAVYREMLEAMGVRVPVVIASRATRVARLSVPRQGFGMYDLSAGSAAFRDYVNRHAGRDIAPDGPERLYVSRTRLGPQRGSILGEARIEAYLADEGYEIFHPQLASQNEQIARYKAAKFIVGTDCSPLHLLGYVGNADQKAAVLTRRSMEIGGFLVRQLQAFKNMQAVEINTLVNDWMPQPGSRPSRSSWGEVDFPRMHAELLAAGMIRNPTPWRNLTADERAAELARLEQSHKTSFKPYRQDAA